MPPDQVVGSSGKVKSGVWTEEFLNHSLRASKGGDSASVFVPGFLREPDGWLRVLFPHTPKKPL
jgi:hypothetical protein